ncbi:hypothetical protein [Streptomyces sp. NBC_00872]|uniref:hypothetical protein n=1 Tax=Streptomyces sp. NBC_00872 TaxID=2903686 RepID=UPI0038659AC7|nr:hypothetical protein OG214_37770 [Streptomyces sp. NBC_00872]
MVDDDVVLVQVEAAPRTSTGSARVCVRSDVGTAVVLWAGASEEAGGEHHVEWSIDEDVSWGSSMWPAAVPSFGLWGGASMSFVKTPRLGLGWFGWLGSCGEFDVLGDAGFVEGAVAEHGEQDTDALTGEAEEGLGVCVLNAKGICL